ncbi:hypothetical protein DSO57_1018194 [Entomophthora muscae]|uniref:Uncharacterized protein n=1 Tax=Entomophthora muscae TaxID=34485 RepID=A0ACC2RJ13_9FUNG|nr:hypothetical protein DSO57_1018194 [Entomophthora muscae]
MCAIVLAQVTPSNSINYNISPSLLSSTTLSFATSIPMLGGATENFAYTVNAGPGSSSLGYNTNLSSSPGASTFEYGTSGTLASSIISSGSLSSDSSQSLTAAQIDSEANSFVQNAYVHGVNSSAISMGSGSSFINFNAFSTLNKQATTTSYSHTTPTHIP